MRIAVFVKGTIFHSVYGGLETQNQVLCEGLAKNGHDVTIFTPQRDYAGECDRIHSGIRYIFVPCVYKMGRFFGFFGFSDKNNWVNKSHEAFNSLYDVKAFDLVISQSTAGIGVVKRKKNYDFKSIMVAHGSIISEYRTYLLELKDFSFKKLLKLVPNTGYALKNFFTRQRDCVHGVDKVITVSNFVKDALIEETYAMADKFVVINNGIQSPDINIRDKKASLNVLFSGRLEYSKGVLLLIKSFADVVKYNPNVKLIIAGDGPLKKDLELLTTDLGIATNVNILGWLNKESLSSIYETCSILVLPTLRIEGFPMSIIEAMSYGLVVVASDIGGSRDAIINEKTGFLVTSGDIDQLTTTLKQLLSNSESLSELMTSSRQHYDSNFTSEIMINKYMDLINNL